MKTHFSRIWVSAAVAAMAITGAYAQGTPSFLPGQVIVKFRPGAVGGANIVHTAVGAKVKSQIPQIGAQVVRLRSGMTVEQALRYYRKLSTVEYAEPNYIVKPTYAPNDPLFGQQWHIPQINIPLAWDLGLGAATTKIAIVDTGVDYNHEDLRGKVILGRDTVNDTNDPMDNDGHGTHVAGIAAATSDNNVGGAGVGFNCSIIAVKVLDPFGSAESVAAGIVNATDLGAAVINMSLGAYGDAQVQRDAIAYAKARDVVMVGAAGNDNINLQSFPAANPDVICVASTTNLDEKSDFSNFGADWVDVAAPGSDILSTLPNNTYGKLSGTSMASPVVAGLAGLMRAYEPFATADEIRTAIESTCIPVGDFCAFGRVNALAAINAVTRTENVEAYVDTASLFTDGGTNQGRSLVGEAGNLQVIDGSTVSLESTYLPNHGWAGAAVLTVPLNTTGTVMATSLKFTHQSRREATTTVFLWNDLLGRYVALKSFPGTAGRTAASVKLPNDLSPFLVGGKLKFAVRSSVPSRLARTVTSYRLVLDQAFLEARIRLSNGN